MKTNSLIVSEEVLINVLKEFSKEIEHNESEYLVSIAMKRKLEKDHNKSFCIAFEAKVGNHNNRRNFTATTEEFKDLLKNSLEENTPIDFALVEGTVTNHSEEAFAFQVKRFFPKSMIDIDIQLLNFIHKVVNKYKPGDASLIIVPLIKTSELVPINLSYLIANINVPADSFGGIFLLASQKDSIIPSVIKIWSKI